MMPHVHFDIDPAFKLVAELQRDLERARKAEAIAVAALEEIAASDVHQRQGTHAVAYAALDAIRKTGGAGMSEQRMTAEERSDWDLFSRSPLIDSRSRALLAELKAVEEERDNARMMYGSAALLTVSYNDLEAENATLREELAIHKAAAAMAQDVLNQQAHVLRQVAPDRGDLWQEYADVKAENDALRTQVDELTDDRDRVAADLLAIETEAAARRRFVDYVGLEDAEEQG